ncbi:MAG: hypothetical protein ACT6FE_07835 [Methanosarcinaceae archaeon]
MRLRLKLGLLICILLMTQTAFSYPEYSNESTTAAPSPMHGSSPVNSVGNVVVLRQLIEVDISSAENVIVRETIVFRTTGNYTTDLMVWLPDDAEIMSISRQNMTEDNPAIQLQYMQEGNILKFNDAERLNTPGIMAPMYALHYVIPITMDKESEYTKIIQYPTYINYPVSSLIVTVIPAEGMDIVIKDEGGNVIQGDIIELGINAVIHTWSSPEFKEFTISTKSKGNTTNILPYIAIGIIILAVLTLPFIREKVKGGNDNKFAKKVGTSKEEKKEKEDSDHKNKSKVINVGETITTKEPDLNELEDRYDATLSLLNKIKNDRDSGNLSEKEYKILSGKYKIEAIDLMKTIDELQNKSGQ